MVGRTWTFLAWGLLAAAAGLHVQANEEPGKGRAMPYVRLAQEDIRRGTVERDELRRMGLILFSTSFNRHDGYGDGLLNPEDTVSPGGRPTLGGNGTFLRTNGLDAQTCLECHTIVSNATMPPRLGIGGVGGSNANALIMISEMDIADQEDLDGNARFNGRMANPPFLFGTGGVELLALEMTAELQALAQRALDHPGTDVDLITKGVDFGILRADAQGALDYAGVSGVDDDLVVRPFGRKGEFSTVRAFDLDALQFHMGMQPTEIVGLDKDADQDGVVNEVLPGDLTALHVFATTLERPFMQKLTPEARRGFATFREMGCVECHKPFLDTRRKALPLREPEIEAEPWANAFYEVDLSAAPVSFQRNKRGGLRIPLFADLKRHDMGPGLQESFAKVNEQRNREFTTARLWGVADTAPYLHDGRATTLMDAILLHGGEAQSARDAFADLSLERRSEVLAFLGSLRTPESPAADLLRMLEKEQGGKPTKKAKKPGKSGKSGKSYKTKKKKKRAKKSDKRRQ